jgi:hypothetical protein
MTFQHDLQHLKNLELLDVKKVSSRFEYFLQIFAAEFVLILKMVVLDTELNSASNGDVFKEGHRAKSGAFARNTGF